MGVVVVSNIPFFFVSYLLTQKAIFHQVFSLPFLRTLYIIFYSYLWIIYIFHCIIYSGGFNFLSLARQYNKKEARKLFVCGAEDGWVKKEYIFHENILLSSLGTFRFQSNSINEPFHPLHPIVNAKYGMFRAT